MQVTVSKVVKQPSGQIEINWADGVTQYYGSLDDIKQQITDGFTIDQVRLMEVGWWLARQPNGDNANVVTGKTLTWDLSLANPFKIQ